MTTPPYADRRAPDCGIEPEDINPARDACTTAQGLITSYLAAITGNSRQRIRIGDRETAFQRLENGQIEQLRSSVMQWCELCMRTQPSQAEALGIADYMKTMARGGALTMPGRYPR